jgi:hypothetical protein
MECHGSHDGPPSARFSRLAGLQQELRGEIGSLAHVPEFARIVMNYAKLLSIRLEYQRDPQIALQNLHLSKRTVQGGGELIKGPELLPGDRSHSSSASAGTCKRFLQFCCPSCTVSIRRDRNDRTLTEALSHQQSNYELF